MREKYIMQCILHRVKFEVGLQIYDQWLVQKFVNPPPNLRFFRMMMAEETKLYFKVVKSDQTI